MNKYKKGDGLNELKALREEAGLKKKWLAERLGKSANTVGRWLSDDWSGAIPDRMLYDSVQMIRHELSNKKAKAPEKFYCQYCGEDLPLTHDGRKILSVHTCPSGYKHVLPPRTHDLSKRALTPMVRSK